jgi:UDP:flavonoid glycosyltransferase YjiC (YdhE family)
MDAIAARTPILALPIAFDQPGTASRVVHTGIGLKASPQFASSGHMAKLLKRLLEESTFADNLERLSGSVAASGGTRRAADIIEAALQLRGVPREEVASLD